MIPPAYVKPFLRRQKNDAADAEAIVIAAHEVGHRDALGRGHPGAPVDLRLFCKPNTLKNRRMGVALAGGDDAVGEVPVHLPVDVDRSLDARHRHVDREWPREGRRIGHREPVFDGVAAGAREALDDAHLIMLPRQRNHRFAGQRVGLAHRGTPEAGQVNGEHTQAVLQRKTLGTWNGRNRWSTDR